MEVMTRDVHSVEPDTDIIMAARLLVDFDIVSLPVLQNGRVVGMLSRHDLLKWVAKHPEGANRLKGVVSRNRRKFRQPINVAYLVPGRCVPASPA